MNRKILAASLVLVMCLILGLCLLAFGCRPRTEQTTEPAVTGTAGTTRPAESSGRETDPVGTEPGQTGETTTEPGTDADPMIRWQNGGQRDYLPDEPVEMVKFSEMVYERPDTESLYADFAALTERAAESDEAEKLLEAYYELYTRYISFYSMDCLANIRYSLDT